MQIGESIGLPTNKEVHELSNHINIKHRVSPMLTTSNIHISQSKEHLSGRKEENILFNNAFNTFLFMFISCQIYDIGPLR